MPTANTSHIPKLTIQPDGKLGPWPLPKVFQRTHAQIERVAEYLAAHPDQTLTNKSGFATRILANDLGWTLAVAANTCDIMDSLGILEREKRGRRCFQIMLTADPHILPFDVRPRNQQPNIKELAPEPETINTNNDDDEHDDLRQKEAAIKERIERREQLAEELPATQPEIPDLPPAIWEQPAAPQPQPQPQPALAAVPPPPLEPIEPPSLIDSLPADGIHTLAIDLLNEVARILTTTPTIEQPEVPAYIEVERNHYRDLANKQRERIRTLETEIERTNERTKSLNFRHQDALRRIEALEQNLDQAIKAAQRYQQASGDSIDDDTRRNLDRIIRTAPGFTKYLPENRNDNNGNRT